MFLNLGVEVWDMIVIGDSFAESLAGKLDADYMSVDRRVFPDGELCPRIEGSSDIKGSDVILAFQKMKDETPNDYLMKFFISLRNVKDHGAKRVVCVLPYLTYARQDQKFRDGEPFTIDIVAKLIDFSGADFFITLTSHTHRKSDIIDLFNKCEAYNISGIPALAEHVKKMNLKNPFVLGPDGEAIQWAKEMADIIGTSEFGALEKKRDVDTGQIQTIDKHLNLKSKDVVIVDDIISTGRTVLNAMDICKKSGADSITVAVVHGIMVGDILKKLRQSGVSEIFATNTIENPVSKADVIPIVAEKIKEIL